MGLWMIYEWGGSGRRGGRVGEGSVSGAARESGVWWGEGAGFPAPVRQTRHEGRAARGKTRFKTSEHCAIMEYKHAKNGERIMNIQKPNKKIRLLSLVMAVITLLLTALTACTGSSGTGSDFARLFLSRIKRGEYESAYSMVEFTAPQGHEDFGFEEFASIYNTLFETLKITDIDFTSTALNENNTLTSFEYMLTYKSELSGDISDQYRMMIIRNNDGIFHIQWSPSLVLPEMEWGDTIREAVVSGARGDILANGLQLAVNEPPIAVSVELDSLALSVFGDMYEDPLPTDYEETPEKIEATNAMIDKLSELLGMERTTVMEKMLKDYNGVSLVGEFYPGTLPDSTLSALSQIGGVRVQKSAVSNVRYYPQSGVLSHIVGYVHDLSDEEEEVAPYNEQFKDSGVTYELGDVVGYSGLEREYQTELRPEDGHIIYLRSEGGVNRRTLYYDAPKNGLDIQLTIDPELQLRLEKLMSLSLYDTAEMSGAVVVMNPYTGAVQAIASYPTFDLNAFASGNGAAELDRLEGSNAPLFNRALMAAYPPGSTYKPLTAAAALTYKTIDPDDILDVDIEDDYWTPTGYGVWIWPSIKRASMRNRTEPLNMRNALLNSDNIYFANAALKLGDDRMIEFFNRLGLNESIDFELSVASSQYCNEGEERNYKLLADSGYGQATMLVTPLQMAATYCAFANGGDVVTPYIVDGLYGYDDNGEYVAVSKTTPTPYRKGAISQAVIDRLIPMLKDVVDSRFNGTGQRLRVKNCVVAGKTGTAEIGSDKSREINWFVGFRTGVSRENARLVLVALELPTNKDCSYIKFDIARDLLEMPTAAPEPTFTPTTEPPATDGALTPEPAPTIGIPEQPTEPPVTER